MFTFPGKSRFYLRNLYIAFIPLLTAFSYPTCAQEIISASKDGKWGYIDYWGNTVIPFMYDDATPFNNAKRAQVKIGNKWGLINKNGKRITACKYDEIISWDDLFHVRQGKKWGQIDKNGNIIIKLLFDTVITTNNITVAKLGCKYSAYYKGKQILPLVYDSLDIVYSNPPYIIAGKINKYGVINILGQAEIPVQYARIDYRWDNYFQVTTGNGNRFFTHPSINDSLTYDEYYKFDGFKNGYTVVSKYDCDIYENREGKNIIGKRFHTARTFSEGIAMVTNFDYSRQCIDTLGNVLFDVPEGFYVKDFNDGFAEYLDESTYLTGIINRKGEVILEPVFDRVYHEENYFTASKDGVKEFYDEKGCLLNYSNIEELYEGMCFVRYNEKWGRVDSIFNEVIPVVYDSIQYPTDGLMLACYNGKWGFIDETGNKVIPFIYDEAEFFSEGLAVAKYKGKYGTIDRKNRCRVNFEYDNIKRGIFRTRIQKIKVRLITIYHPDRKSFQ